MEEEICVHYWNIEPPDGPVSLGICKKCGEKKQFRNWKGWNEHQSSTKKDEFEEKTEDGTIVNR